ncbi:MAG: hypothetical protein JJE28_01525 [Actinomycetales bacterium]|nr:hypothetical protein [Actinomycetales bacterium]
MIEVNAVQTRPRARGHQGPDPHEGVAKEDGQVHDIAPKPRPTVVGTKHMVPDDDREIWVFGHDEVSTGG